MKPKNAGIAEVMTRLFGEISRGKNETWGMQDLVPEALVVGSKQWLNTSFITNFLLLFNDPFS